MKMTYLIGMPGCGKSTIMKEFMSRFEGWKQERVIDLLDTHVVDNVRVLGKYEEGQVFSGTDRLSMAVSPKAIEWVETSPPEFVFGEGDRLNNKAFFESCGEQLTIIHLTVSDAERERRYRERGSEQSDKFISTCKTKVKNIVESFGETQTLFGTEPSKVKTFKHETPEDTKIVVNFMLGLLK